ncbi:hypothetical protein Q7689_00630 [Nocardiopsis tropica]|uniref:hypothetical protein n=1 Tax=Nocardiopsis tropica TaxID=109330 RepID=UPI002E8A29A5|nr:hypothetical protein [Nocardiopsis tropica]
MSGADEVLDLIDTTLNDWTVGPDAMRSAPATNTPPEGAATLSVEVSFEHFRTQITEAREAMRPVFEQAREAVRTAYRQVRTAQWALCPHPPQDPDPKAWTAFTDRPALHSRAHRRRGPDPRRISVRRVPARTGRRP